jgi:hypothetical protein
MAGSATPWKLLRFLSNLTESWDPFSSIYFLSGSVILSLSLSLAILPKPSLSPSLSLLGRKGLHRSSPCGSHADMADLTSNFPSSSLVDAVALGMAAISLSSLLSIVGAQGETLILFDLCNVMLLVVDFSF